MASIAPFRGIRYNPEKIRDLSLVVAPPYDVITPSAQDRYYAQHPKNIIRLILGKEVPEDDEKKNRYTRAREFFHSWLKEGVLVQDPVSCLYLYEQRFVHPRTGESLRRLGFLALVRLEPWSARVIFPHEKTFDKPKQDRLALIKACSANLEPIFAFYPDPLETVRALLEEEAVKDPAIDFLEEGIEHRLWLIQDQEKIRAIIEAFQGERLFIADGHHRYETALAFRDELEKADPAPPEVKAKRSYQYVMMLLVCSHDPGLVILPTHRLLKSIPHPSADALLEEVRRFFTVEARDLRRGREAEDMRRVLEEMERLGQGWCVLGMSLGGKDLYFLTLRGDVLQRPLGPDVRVLHQLLIEGLFGASLEEIAYTRDEVEALRAVMAGRSRLAFFLNPPKIVEIQEAAEAQELLPPKSTFFYPKPLSGLVIRRIDRDW